ncbi:MULTISPECIES: PepSY domain-containing protein [unclassified Sulfitobacter]|jgi:hypothetical protein|uniref:PepSY domain-containing protein n=1 Tax=unclassified Sulfitobacter TaxID=196795 RepID=UPI0037468333
MRKFLIATAMIIALPAFAAEVTKDAHLGMTQDEVKASLVEMGYEVRKMKMSGGEIEAYAVMDNKISEVFVDPATGLVTKIVAK